MIKDLIRRGCKINTSEIAFLAGLYVDSAIEDSKHIHDQSDYFELRKINREVLLDIHIQTGVGGANLFDLKSAAETALRPSTPSQSTQTDHSNESEETKNSDTNTATNTMDFDTEFDETSTKLELLYNVIISCDLHRKMICDINKNNPLHLYLYNPITATTNYYAKNIEQQQINIVKLLKFECRFVCFFCFFD